MLNPNGKSRLGHIVAGHVQVAVISPAPPPDAAARGSDLAVTAPELNAGDGVGRLGLLQYVDFSAAFLVFIGPFAVHGTLSGWVNRMIFWEELG